MGHPRASFFSACTAPWWAATHTAGAGSGSTPQTSSPPAPLYSGRPKGPRPELRRASSSPPPVDDAGSGAAPELRRAPSLRLRPQSPLHSSGSFSACRASPSPPPADAGSGATPEGTGRPRLSITADLALPFEYPKRSTEYPGLPRTEDPAQPLCVLLTGPSHGLGQPKD